MSNTTTTPAGVVSSTELGNDSGPRRDAGEVMARGLQAIARRFGHIYWSAGEEDCPNEIKAPNGELFKLRCKKCGDENPVSKWCPVESLPNTISTNTEK